MDNISVGNPRTMKDHAEWRMRDQERAASERDAATLAHASNLHMGLVISSDRYGNVLLEQFSNRDGDGQWFSCLNNVRPHPGQHVAWTYLDGSPFVIGVIPDQTQPWLVPDERGWTHLEHFHRGGVDSSGHIGELGWNVTLGGTGSPSQFMTGNAKSYGGGMGWHRIHAGTGVNSYAILHSRTTNFIESAVREVEIGFGHTFTQNYLNIGLTNNFVAASTARISIQGDTDKANWRFFTMGSGLSQEAEMNVPVVANSYMTVNFRHLEDESWEATVTDWTNEVEDTKRLTPNTADVGMYLGGTIYNRVDGVQRSLDFDYIRYTIMDVRRGPSDDEE